MAARFVVVSKEDVTAFSEQQKNDNTMKKQPCDLNIFKEFFESCDETKVKFCSVRAELPSWVRSEAENKSILCFKLESVIEFSLSLLKQFTCILA